MNTLYHFKVADLWLALELPPDIDAGNLLPSFRSFCCNNPPPGLQPAFACSAAATPATSTTCRPCQALETAINGAWKTIIGSDAAGHYVLEVCHTGHPSHQLELAPDFRSGRLYLQPADPLAGEALSTLLRIAFSQVLLLHQGVSLHASAVVLNGQGFLFTGCSGTGKSTHAARWTSAFEGCTLLNDDNPAVRLKDEQFRVYGTPWSGKTPCYRNLSVPLGGIVRLRQAPRNAYTPCRGIEAFTTLLASSALVTSQDALSDSLHTTLVQMVDAIPVGRLDCLPTTAAAQCCAQGLQTHQEQFHSNHHTDF